MSLTPNNANNFKCLRAIGKLLRYRPKPNKLGIGIAEFMSKVFNE